MEKFVGQEGPFVWIGIDSTGIKKVTIEASNDVQEKASFEIYSKVKPLFGILDFVVRGE